MVSVRPYSFFVSDVLRFAANSATSSVMTIHPTAIVHPNAQLAQGVEVQAFSIIGEYVAIDEGTVIGPHCVLEGRTTIGKDNLVFSGAQLGVRSQDLKHAPGLVGRAIIGDRNVIREHFTLSACTMESDSEVDRVTSIGDDCMFMASSHVGHDCHLGNGVIMANCAVLGGHVDVGARATIGGLSGVHQGCAIGAFAFTGGHSRIVIRQVGP